ncbi:hypothetical protein LOAG_03350 [Loa loa]|uniref:Uncharacterized protein n=1 Tax=Loa loa TaxID=7209 RepID=A0A1S0U550_LOALO|nr:hypothetical protein LOAG_03350 [Loa loa]EFO25131.1 hypothetical protein LOAG_03350 [Loa loa]
MASSWRPLCYQPSALNPVAISGNDFVVCFVVWWDPYFGWLTFCPATLNIARHASNMTYGVRMFLNKHKEFAATIHLYALGHIIINLLYAIFNADNDDRLLYTEL